MTMLAKWLRRASSLFSEKPKLKPDDFGMEHFLLYHGLAGSSPEYQREFKDVRADILSAISRNSSQNLCINLKLAPLWWEDKLKRIFDEAKVESADATIRCLLPDVSGAQDVTAMDPLSHEDWRVRANAAIVLAMLGADQAEGRMIVALDSTAGSVNAAYCHIARSLAGFRTVSARQALEKHLLDAEPWIRVDSVNAIAKWPLSEIRSALLQAFAEHHAFIDYASVALARSHNPLELISSNDDQLADLGAAVLLGLFDAARGPFSSNSDLLIELAVQQCLDPLEQATTKKVSPVKLRALSELAAWLEANYHQFRLEAEGYPEPEESAAATKSATQMVTNLDIKEAIRTALTDSKSNAESKIINSAVRHAILLAGEHKLAAAVDLLTEMLDSAPLYRNEIIESLGLIEDKSSAPVLIKLARQIVNVERRTEMSLSANPIEEAEPEQAKTYWYILRALGHLPTQDSANFLLLAAQDEAADKREEALAALIRMWEKSDGKLPAAAEVKKLLQKGLHDPSAQVRVRSLEGVALIKDVSLVAPSAKLINAQEMSVNRAAFTTLEKLAAAGHKAPVAAALAEVKNGLTNTVKIKRIDEFSQRHL